jgi:hypothetical protein
MSEDSAKARKSSPVEIQREFEAKTQFAIMFGEIRCAPHS